MARVLVTGGYGMLGRVLVKEARLAGHQVWAGDSHYTDVTSAVRLKAIAGDIDPDVVFNCAGVISSKHVSDSHMIAVNAEGPWRVREAFPRAHVVHVSTDCVFNGLRRGGTYAFCDPPNAQDVYGRSKALGECPANVNVRCSFIGFDHGLLAWFINQTEGATIDGWARAEWNGGTVYDVAKGLMAHTLTLNPGVYHMGAFPTTKYQLLCRLVEVFGKHVSIVPQTEPHINRVLSTNISIDRDLEFLRAAWYAKQGLSDAVA